jgi:hypothetical protein
MKGIRLLYSSIVNPWVGDRGTCFLVSDDEAAAAVATGMLEYIPDDEHNSIPVVQVEGVQVPEHRTVVDLPEEERPREMTIEERYAEMLNADGSPRADLFEQEAPVASPAPSGEMKKPYSNRPKSEWIAYAVQQGHDAEEAEGMTKNDLMSLYGERL